MHYFVDSLSRMCIIIIVSDAAYRQATWRLGTQSTPELIKLQSGFADISLNKLRSSISCYIIVYTKRLLAVSSFQTFKAGV